MNTETPHILIAVDESNAAGWAIDVGAALARRMGGRVTLVHVIPPPSTGVGEGVLVLADDLVDRLRAAGADLRASLARRLPDGVPVTSALRDGPPAQEIVAQARQAAADLIVVGSRGGGRWSHFILGSTAEAVIREAPCPVVTVSRDPSVRTTVATGAGHAERGPAASDVSPAALVR
jgi:nucleotide-binding universal stress UspA family protein